MRFIEEELLGEKEVVQGGTQKRFLEEMPITPRFTQKKLLGGINMGHEPIQKSGLVERGLGVPSLLNPRSSTSDGNILKSCLYAHSVENIECPQCQFGMLFTEKLGNILRRLSDGNVEAV